MDKLNENFICFINNSNIQQLFEKNQTNLVNAYKAQNYGNFETALNHLEDAKNDFYLLGNLLDKTQQSSLIYRENREILSSENIKQFIKDYPNIKLPIKDPNLNNYQCNRKPKQQKTKWTMEEEKALNEAIDIFGKRSKYSNIKHIMYYYI